MKVIDLLNTWVEDRNKLPKKIKVEEKIFEYHETGDLYIAPNDNYFLISSYLDRAERLNREVEVIQENKEIEELEISELDRKVMAAFIIKNREKINELVRAVNKINKQLEEQQTEDIDTVERELNKMF